MSRLLKWDGTEMDFVSNLTLRAMRMLFSTWTNHLAVCNPATTARIFNWLSKALSVHGARGLDLSLLRAIRGAVANKLREPQPGQHLKFPRLRSILV